VSERDLRRKVAELEKRVRELELQPRGVPVPYPYPVPYYPPWPLYPTYPWPGITPMPWWQIPRYTATPLYYEGTIESPQWTVETVTDGAAWDGNQTVVAETLVLGGGTECLS
jgi:hypothetical protein